MVGKGKRGIRGDHSLGSDGALRAQFQQVFRVVLFAVVVAEAIERNHDHVGLGLLGRGVRAMVYSDHALGSQAERLQPTQSHKKPR